MDIKDEQNRRYEGLQLDKDLLDKTETDKEEAAEKMVDARAKKGAKKNRREEGNQEASRAADAPTAFQQLTGWDDDESVHISLRTIIGGDILAGRWFRRHMTYLMFLVFLAICYVTNRYAYQQEMIDNRKLILQLEDRRLRAVVATSNLSEYTRRSNIARLLSDSTLKSSPQPFYFLKTDN